MAKNVNNLNSQPYVLIIEHDQELRKVMEVSLAQAGVKVKTVKGFANALQIMQIKSPDVFILDFNLQKADLGNLITAFRQNQKDNSGAVMISTANRLEDDWRRKYKPDSVIYKPFDIRYLIRLILLLVQNQSVQG
jgi:DNA-binding response OmpR family regulator